MKKRWFYCNIIAAAILLNGCSFPGNNKGGTSQEASSKEIISEEEMKEELPVIKVDKPVSKDMSVSEDEGTAEIPDENNFHGYIVSEEEKSDPRVQLLETASEDCVSMVFTGDICFDDHYSNMNAYHGRANGIYDSLSSALIDQLTGADICMVNNEFPYSDRGTPTPGKTFTFRAKPERVEILNQLGVDIVSLANNHAYDHGPEALLDTFDILDSAGIAYVGAGANLAEAMKPYYFIAGGNAFNMKIGFVSATQIERNDPPDTKEATEASPGVLRTLNPDKFLTVISEAKNNSDFVVVYVHWGSENTYQIEQTQRDLAAKYEEAGADLIIGDHSHCLQGIDYINDTPVIYSMGNFWFNSKNLDTGIVQALVNKEGLISFRFLPCLQHDCKTDLMIKGFDADYDRILGVMASLSKDSDLSIDADGYVHKGAGNGVEPVEPRALVKPSYAVSENIALPVPIVPEGTAGASQ